MRARKRTSGFTLVELMVALAVGGVAIGAMYTIGAASNKAFRQQALVGTTQGALRLAMMQVKRDISRAGFLSTPRADLPGQSGSLLATSLSSSINTGGQGWLAGIASFRDNVVDGSNNSPVDPIGINRANGFTTDELTMVANYETANEYLGVHVETSQSVSLNADPNDTFHALFQDFAWSNLGVPQAAINTELFTSVFAVGRLIRIQAPNRMRHFARIAGVAFPGTRIVISFQEAMPANVMTSMEGGWIAPLSIIRYDAVTGTGDDAERINDTGAQDNIGYLRRVEVDPSNRANPLVIAAGNVINTRQVLAYLAAFNLEFTLNGQGLDLGQSDNYVIGSVGTANQVNANPQLVRAVKIQLAARLPTEDPSMISGPPAQPLSNCTNLRCFKIWPTGTGGTLFAARVRVLRGEVFVPNIAFENY